MKKEDLIKLGLDEETAKKVADASTEELKGYIPYERFTEVNTEKNNLSSALKERDAQLETLKKSTGDVEALRQQITTLQTENKNKDTAHVAEVKQLRIDNAVSAALTSAKAKNVTAVKALLNLKDAELLEDGTIKGLADQVKKLQTAEDSKFLFGAASATFKGAKPGDAGKEGADDKVNTATMSYDELCAFLADNPDTKL